MFPSQLRIISCFFFPSPPSPPLRQKTTPKPKTNLLSLPPELILLIASDLRSFSCLNAFSRTTHSLHNVLHPQLLFLASTTPSPALTTRQSRSVLHYAAQHNRIPLLHTLLSLGGTRYVNEPDNTGTYPLGSAALLGYVETVNVLLAHGADVEVAKPGTGLTPLHLAALGGHADVVSVLIQAGADLGARWEVNGFSVLHTAVVGGCVPVVEMLVEAGLGVVDMEDCDAAVMELARYLENDVVMKILEAVDGGGRRGGLLGEIGAQLARLEGIVAASLAKMGLQNLRESERDLCRTCLRERMQTASR